MRRISAVLTATIALSLGSAADAAGQVCMGNATPEGDWGVQAIGGLFKYDLRDEVTGVDLGVEGTANLDGPLAATAAYTMRMPESGDLHIQVARAGLTLGVPPSLLPLPIPLAICAYAGVGFSSGNQESSESDFTSTAFPVGVGIGIPIQVSPALTLYPAITPQYIFANVEGEVIGFPIEESDDAFAIEIATGFSYGRVIGSASVFLSDLAPALGATPFPSRLIALKVGVGM
ncbi:MAG TPA: hypothetical protein VFI91_00885 [Longimicrobiaceae bacterium]|nr:hypothetical protein [Longimicrobiaceae bacterium]